MGSETHSTGSLSPSPAAALPVSLPCGHQPAREHVPLLCPALLFPSRWAEAGAWPQLRAGLWAVVRHRHDLPAPLQGFQRCLSSRDRVPQ